MRRLTYGAACSLDGYIARVDGSVDWLQWSEDVLRLTTAFWARIDTVLMGRRTYEVALAAGSGAYAGVTNYLFSRTLRHSPQPDVHLVRDDAATFVANLKQQPGADICVMGGGDFARSLFAADLIDEVGINVQPILLGDGIPMFHRLPREFSLQLVQLEELTGGCVYALYAVQR